MKDQTIKYLTIKEVANLYGERINYKWLSPDGCDWIDSKGKVTGSIICEIEDETIKDCYKISK